MTKPSLMRFLRAFQSGGIDEPPLGKWKLIRVFHVVQGAVTGIVRNTSELYQLKWGEAADSTKL